MFINIVFLTDEKRAKVPAASDRYGRVLQWIFHAIIIVSVHYICIHYFSFAVNWKNRRIDADIGMNHMLLNFHTRHVDYQIPFGPKYNAVLHQLLLLTIDRTSLTKTDAI